MEFESILKTAFPFIVTAAGIGAAFGLVMMVVAYTVLAERKLLGWMQGRLGPNRVGPWGLFQPVADRWGFMLKGDLARGH